MAKKPLSTPTRLFWLLFFLFVSMFVAAIVLDKKFGSYSDPARSTSEVSSISNNSPFDFGNQTVEIENHVLRFDKGIFEGTTSDGTVHRATLTQEDIDATKTRGAGVLIDSTEGSGTFVYLVGAMVKDGQTLYSEPQALGDRVRVMSLSTESPQTENNGVITVKYLERRVGEPMSAEPTHETTRTYAFQDDGNLMGVISQ